MKGQSIVCLSFEFEPDLRAQEVYYPGPMSNYLKIKYVMSPEYCSQSFLCSSLSEYKKCCVLNQQIIPLSSQRR